MTFLINLEFTQILCSFSLALEWKAKKRYLSHQAENNFVLSDEKDNTSGPINGEGMADLNYLRKLLATCQNSYQPSVWEVTDSFVLPA